MNDRQQKYKKNRLIGMKPENAAVSAGYALSYARAKAYRIERSANVGMRDAFERKGLTDNKLVELALAGLEATKPPTKESPEWEDWSARHRYLETILKLTERIKDNGISIDLSDHKHFVNIYLPEQDGLETTTETRNLFKTPLV